MQWQHVKLWETAVQFRGDLQLSVVDFTGLQGIWLCKDVTAPLISQLCFFIGSSAAMHNYTSY